MTATTNGQTSEPAPWSNSGDYTLVGTTATFRGSFYNVLNHNGLDDHDYGDC